MHNKKAWTLVDRPTPANAIRGLWLFRKKPTSNPQKPIKYKARFVAMGNTQVEGEDHFETFAPTGKPTSLRILVALAAHFGWEFHQMDAVTAFLNSDLFETIFVKKPEGFKQPGEDSEVCLLLKSLYGLKQAPKYWQDDVEEFLLSVGFMQCEVDHCIYIRRLNDSFTTVYVHVDDLAITGNDIITFKNEISLRWEMEDLGTATTVVGIKIKRHSELMYSIGQSTYALKILERFESTHVKPSSTPFPSSLKLYKPDQEEIEDLKNQKHPYRNLVRSLMYLAQCTRPDLAHAVGTLSQHLDWRDYQHWDAARHVLQYLKGTVKIGIVYCWDANPVILKGLKSELCPQSLCDAGWAGDKDSHRSTTGYVFLLANGAISWRSRL